jgi:hypothetical protein
VTSSLKLPRNGAVGFIDWLGCIVFMTPEGLAQQIKSDQRRTEKRFFAESCVREMICAEEMVKRARSRNLPNSAGLIYAPWAPSVSSRGNRERTLIGPYLRSAFL